MRLLIDITTSISCKLFTFILFISVMQSTNGAQFLNFACLFLTSGFLAAASASTAPIVIVPVCTHQCSHKDLTSA